MDLTNANSFLSQHSHGVLMTIKRDGRPQASNISYHYADGVARISVTASRAKTKNLHRDPRASLYVTSQDFWRFVVAEGNAGLSEVTTSPGDAAGQELLEVYNAVSSDPHPNPAEFYEAMVKDERLVIRLAVERAYGQLPG